MIKAELQTKVHRIRVEIDHNSSNEELSRFWILVPSECKTVSMLSNLIIKRVGAENEEISIKLSMDGFSLLDEECIEILKEDDIVKATISKSTCVKKRKAQEISKAMPSKTTDQAQKPKKPKISKLLKPFPQILSKDHLKQKIKVSESQKTNKGAANKRNKEGGDAEKKKTASKKSTISKQTDHGNKKFLRQDTSSEENSDSSSGSTSCEPETPKHQLHSKSSKKTSVSGQTNQKKKQNSCDAAGKKKESKMIKKSATTLVSSSKSVAKVQSKNKVEASSESTSSDSSEEDSSESDSSKKKPNLPKKCVGSATKPTTSAKVKTKNTKKSLELSATQQSKPAKKKTTKQNASSEKGKNTKKQKSPQPDSSQQQAKPLKKNVNNCTNPTASQNKKQVESSSECSSSSSSEEESSEPNSKSAPPASMKKTAKPTTAAAGQTKKKEESSSDSSESTSSDDSGSESDLNNKKTNTMKKNTAKPSNISTPSTQVQNKKKAESSSESSDSSSSEEASLVSASPKKEIAPVTKSNANATPSNTKSTGMAGSGLKTSEAIGEANKVTAMAGITETKNKQTQFQFPPRGRGRGRFSNVPPAFSKVQTDPFREMKEWSSNYEMRKEQGQGNGFNKRNEKPKDAELVKEACSQKPQSEVKPGQLQPHTDEFEGPSFRKIKRPYVPTLKPNPEVGAANTMKDSQSISDSSFLSFPLMGKSATPQAGDVIAFKVFQLNVETCTPEESAYQQRTVENFHNGKVTLKENDGLSDVLEWDNLLAVRLVSTNKQDSVNCDKQEKLTESTNSGEEDHDDLLSEFLADIKEKRANLLSQVSCQS